MPALGVADHERGVAHAQSGMAAFGVVRAGPAPVLAEEERQVPPGRTEVVLVRIETEEDVVGADPVVEAVDEAIEERLPTDRLEDRDLVGRVVGGWFGHHAMVAAVGGGCQGAAWPGGELGVAEATISAAMGQPVTVIEKPSSRPGVVRFEINRTLTGMGHERYKVGTPVEGNRPPDELARRLFDHGGIDSIHINSNVITLDMAKGGNSDGIAGVIEDLYTYYRPGVEVPTPESFETPEDEG